MNDNNNGFPQSDDSQTPQEEPGYSSPEFQPPMGPGQFDYNAQGKKKSKTWLWVTLALVIPLSLCCLGFAGCTYLLIDETKPAFDVTNRFYSALRDGRDYTEFTCSRNAGDLEDSIDEYYRDGGRVTSFDFKGFDVSDQRTEIDGVVNRARDRQRETIVTLVKEDDALKVCGIEEDVELGNLE